MTPIVMQSYYRISFYSKHRNKQPSKRQQKTTKLQKNHIARTLIVCAPRTNEEKKKSNVSLHCAVFVGILYTIYTAHSCNIMHAPAAES